MQRLGPTLGQVTSFDHDRVRVAIEHLDRHRHDPPSLTELGEVVGLSPHHFQRLFRRFVGLSPKRYLGHLLAVEAGAWLEDERPVLEVAHHLGLSSPSRVHDLMVTVEAMSPGERKRKGAGETIAWGIHDTLFGPCRLARTRRGVCSLDFLDPDAPRDAEVLRERWPGAEFVEDAEGGAPLIERLHAGEDPQAALHLDGTNFQVQVWRALLAIPGGSIVSYQDVAEALGRPRSVRAVANAIGSNPVGWLIPCHRVLRANGELSGYRWGEARKRRLLAREQGLART